MTIFDWINANVNDWFGCAVTAGAVLYWGVGLPWMLKGRAQ